VGMMGFGGFGMMLWMVIFWVVVVGVALWLLSRLFPGTGRHSSAEAPPESNAGNNGAGPTLVILKERYARGEITQAEYQQIRKDLEG
jgi:putative membrane protein